MTTTRLDFAIGGLSFLNSSLNGIELGQNNRIRTLQTRILSEWVDIAYGWSFILLGLLPKGLPANFHSRKELAGTWEGSEGRDGGSGLSPSRTRWHTGKTAGSGKPSDRCGCKVQIGSL